MPFLAAYWTQIWVFGVVIMIELLSVILHAIVMATRTSLPCPIGQNVAVYEMC